MQYSLQKTQQSLLLSISLFYLKRAWEALLLMNVLFDGISYSLVLVYAQEEEFWTWNISNPL